MAYNYGPPPPAPGPAPHATGPQTAYAPYTQPPYHQGSQRGGHNGRGGRGGSDRGGYQPPVPAYGYGQHPSQYGQQHPGPYPQVPPNGYAPPQHWPAEHAQPHPQQPPPHAPLPAENYHPNYAPQIYQQPAYAGQPAYPPAQPPYGPGYTAQGPPNPQWGGQQPNPASYGGGGRGGRPYNERGGHKSQMMGPPIRIGFDSPAQPAPPAPVSNPYPQPPYGAPQPPQTAYPVAPYQGYPPPAPYMPVPAPYDSASGHGARHHNRGGFHSNHSKPRSQFGGDKMRNRNRAQPSQTPPTQHQKPDTASTGKKKKRRTNTLGLTPGDESDGFDENEEELEELYGADAPQPTDIAVWIAERRANFPTKARIEAKKAAALANRNADGANNAEDPKALLLQQKAERLRKQLEKVESSIKRKREQQDEGDDMRDVDLSPSPSSDAKSDDEKPEVISSRHDANNYLPPPPRKADPKKHCKYYSTGGTCGKKGKCRFVHDPVVREEALKERERNGGRLTLQQRLILNDKDQQDLTIVKSLKFLQDKGVLDAAAKASSEPPKSNREEKPDSPHLPPPPIREERLPNGHGLPPIPPPSVVSDSPKTKYSGWNLSGFGNTGVRASDI
ncbi:hypothetical protein QBC47DRAFT_358100 [Echria macrotheca]|uniref:C3H1-type domain-containing protein n=1 Tax=Echria macrotheca TaxID=438768 RepID=A0AAJ0BLS9_9PEZI|nr:hypothetical protein QBC47DRAFT_358100 [Echria macrotheca]